MNFLYLKEVVAQLKHKFRCPGCRKFYSNRSIDVFTGSDKDLDVSLTCSKCQMQTFAKVTFMDEEDIKLAMESPELNNKPLRKHRNIKVKTNHVAKITENDVLDVKNFLKNFKGNFKSIFNK